MWAQAMSEGGGLGTKKQPPLRAAVCEHRVIRERLLLFGGGLFGRSLFGRSFFSWSGFLGGCLFGRRFFGGSGFLGGCFNSRFSGRFLRGGFLNSRFLGGFGHMVSPVGILVLGLTPRGKFFRTVCEALCIALPHLYICRFDCKCALRVCA